MMVWSKVVTPVKTPTVTPAEAGVQPFYWFPAFAGAGAGIQDPGNILERLDSRIHGNDRRKKLS